MLMSNVRQTICIMREPRARNGGVRMSVTITHASSADLHERLQRVLAEVDMAESDLAELASRYMLTPEELTAWDEVRSIRFLLGDE